MNKLLLISILFLLSSCNEGKKEKRSSPKSTNIVQLSKDYLLSHVIHDLDYADLFSGIRKQDILFYNQYKGNTGSISYHDSVWQYHRDTMYDHSLRKFYYKSNIKNDNPWHKSDPKGIFIGAFESLSSYNPEELKSKIFVYFLEPITDEKMEVISVFLSDYCLHQYETITFVKDIESNTIVNYIHEDRMSVSRLYRNSYISDIKWDENYCE